MAAAVADYTPSESPAEQSREERRTADADADPHARHPGRPRARCAAARRGRVLVGFAAETDDVVRKAREKRARKQVDLIVANDVSQPDRGFDVETNAVTIIGRGWRAGDSAAAQGSDCGRDPRSRRAAAAGARTAAAAAECQAGSSDPALPAISAEADGPRTARSATFRSRRRTRVTGFSSTRICSLCGARRRPAFAASRNGGRGPCRRGRRRAARCPARTPSPTADNSVAASCCRAPAVFASAADALAAVRVEIGPDCQRCKLHTLGRRRSSSASAIPTPT